MVLARARWGFSLLLLSAGCSGGTETGNPPFVAALSYTGTSSAPEAYAIREPGRVATIHRAWLDLASVRFSVDGGCKGEGESIELPALGVGDHAAGAHVETSFEARSASFCALTLPFARTARLPDGAPEELQGRSLLLLGELSDGTPFSVASSAEPSVYLLGPAAGITLSNERASLLIAFDFAAWLRAIPFEEASRDGGEVRIDSSHNAALLGAFEAALGGGVSLYRDGDRDGVLDENDELLARPR